jgi:hypothetical protein
VSGKPIKCRERFKNDAVLRDTSFHIVIRRARRARHNPGDSTWGWPHETSKNRLVARRNPTRDTREVLFILFLNVLLMKFPLKSVTYRKKCEYPDYNDDDFK